MDPITMTTPVALGVCLAILASYGGAMWWASRLQTKLDVVLDMVASWNVRTTELRDKLEKINDRLVALETKESVRKDNE